MCGKKSAVGAVTVLAVLVLCHCPSVCMDVAGCACSMCNSARHVMVAVLVELIPLWVVGSRSAEGRDFGARRPRQKRISGRGKARLGLRGTAAGVRPVDASLVPARSPLKSPPPGALAGLRGGGEGDSPWPAPLHCRCLWGLETPQEWEGMPEAVLPRPSLPFGVQLSRLEFAFPLASLPQSRGG